MKKFKNSFKKKEQSSIFSRIEKKKINEDTPKTEKINTDKNNLTVEDILTNCTSPKTTFYTCRPKIIDRKLTIVLLENSVRSEEVKQNVLKIISRLSDDDFICVIQYSNTVEIGNICKVKEFDKAVILKGKEENKQVHFYDAIESLKRIVETNYHKKEKNNNEEILITEIDIFGIGTGADVGSKSSIEEAIKQFNQITYNKSIKTKYFCFTENTFAKVAAIGFHSIGAFPQIRKK